MNNGPLDKCSPFGALAFAFVFRAAAIGGNNTEAPKAKQNSVQRKPVCDEDQEGHAADRRAAAAISSSAEHLFAPISADQYSDGMLPRCAHDLTVWIDVSVRVETACGPASRIMSL